MGSDYLTESELLEAPKEENPNERLALLGEPIDEFSIRAGRLARNLLVAAGLICGGAALSGFLIFGLHAGHVHFVAIGVFMFFGGFALAWRAVQNRGLRILVYPEAIVRFHRGSFRAIFWDQIERIWVRHIEGHTAGLIKGSLVLSAERSGHEPMNFDDSLPRLKELAELLQSRTMTFLWPKVRDAFEAGMTITFGTLQIHSGGITCEPGMLSWSEVDKVEFTDKNVTIHKKGKWTNWHQKKLADMPNCHVLRALVEHALRFRRGSK